MYSHAMFIIDYERGISQRTEPTASAFATPLSNIAEKNVISSICWFYTRFRVRENNRCIFVSKYQRVKMGNF